MIASDTVALSPEREGNDKLRIIDADVHPTITGGVRTLFPYMTKAWQHRFSIKNDGLAKSALTPRFEHPSGSALRADAVPPEGGPAGSNPDFIKQDLLQSHGIDVAVMTSLQAGTVATVLAGPDESVVLCAAFNDCFLDQWKLREGGPLRLAMCVPTQDPQAAAAEIRRVGGEKAVVAVQLSLLDILMGNRYYYPIYAEAERYNLPILIHPLGIEGIYHGTAAPAGGFAENYSDRYVSLSQIAEANLSSLMFSGTLERFPGLKFIFVEYGFAWAVPLLWRMDRTWKSLRYDTPWVTKSPWDYIHEQVRFTTQPLDEPKKPEHLAQIIDMLGEDVLLFSTDYPHWDNDMPEQSLRMLNAEQRRKIFSENGLKAFRL